MQKPKQHFLSKIFSGTYLALFTMFVWEMVEEALEGLIAYALSSVVAIFVTKVLSTFAIVSATQGIKVTIKRFLINVLEEVLTPMRDIRHYYETHLDEVYEIIRSGTKKANEKANTTLNKVKAHMGIDYFENNKFLEETSIFLVSLIRSLSKSLSVVNNESLNPNIVFNGVLS